MIVLYTTALYLVVGVIFSIPFLARWIHQIDDSTQNTSIAFKLTILPGCIVFWPVLLKKFLAAKYKTHD